MAIGAGTVLVILTAQATSELLYLPIYALMAIHYARKWKRGGVKALLGGVRSKDSR